MPELKCTVQTCAHNQDFLCELDAIKVGGNSAKNSEETCCDSFEERREGSYSNTMGEKKASDTSSIDCEAQECQYNYSCKCHAGKISVEGSSACDCDGTECATFKCC